MDQNLVERNLDAELDAIVQKYRADHREDRHELYRLTDADFARAVVLLPSKDFDTDSGTRHLANSGRTPDPQGGTIMIIDVRPGATPA